MVEERLTDGKRIAQLLASEIESGARTLRDLSVVDADPDAEPTVDGAFGYAVALGSERLAEVYVQPDRARVEFLVGQVDAVDAAENEGLRVRPKAVRPPRTLVFVEDGAQVKWAVPVFEAVVEARSEE
jgi:hypothetical protein